jgi:CBS domain-containing protein
LTVVVYQETPTMIICPDCGFENIEGVDHCAGCRQSLTSLSKPKASTALGRGLMKDPISVLSSRAPVAVAPSMPVGEVLQRMIREHIGCVLVVDEDRLVGIFSERDALVRLNTQASALRDHPISDFMTERPRTLELTDKLAFAVHRMALGGYRHIPILTDGRPSGIISVRDILRYASEKLKPTKTGSA